MTADRKRSRMVPKLGLIALIATITVGFALATENSPAVGDEARDFELNALGGEAMKLSKQVEAGPVVIVVLRGYPGYQCPICTAQFGEFLGQAEAFKKSGASVLFVYPGPADGLKERAAEFVRGKDYPAHFQILIDPDFIFTNAYGLRWNAKGETAYPASFVVDMTRKVTFATISKTHGDRSQVAEILKAISATRD